MKLFSITTIAVCLIISTNAFAQLKVNANMNNALLGAKIAVPKPPVLVNWANIIKATEYNAWKIGTTIPTNQLGSKTGLFSTMILGGDATSEGYGLGLKKGAITVMVRVENKKKYLVTVHYSAQLNINLNVNLVYLSGNPDDVTTTCTQETIDFAPAKQFNGDFSFIINPELSSKNPKDIPGAGDPATVDITLSIPSLQPGEVNKSTFFATFAYGGMTVKEIQ